MMEFELDLQVLNSLLLVLSVILVDTLLGIIRAIARQEFDVRVLPQFLQTSVFPYVGSLIVLAVFSFFVPEIKALLMTAAAFLLAKYLAEIKDKLQDMMMLSKADIEFFCLKCLKHSINTATITPRLIL